MTSDQRLDAIEADVAELENKHADAVQLIGEALDIIARVCRDLADTAGCDIDDYAEDLDRVADISALIR